LSERHHTGQLSGVVAYLQHEGQLPLGEGVAPRDEPLRSDEGVCLRDRELAPVVLESAEVASVRDHPGPHAKYAPVATAEA